MLLILNVVLCLLVIAMVVAPLARAIAVSRPRPAGGLRRREAARSAAPSPSAARSRSGRSFAPGL